MNEPPVPSVLAMLVCDQVIVDQLSGKTSLIGVFDNINSLNFPASVNCTVYARLVDAEGNYKFRLRLVNLKDESLINQIEIDGVVKTQASPAELALYFMGVVLPAPGKYEIQLYANDIYLSRVTMTATHVSAGGSPWQQPQQ